MTVLEQLQRDEGEILHCYQDSMGYSTIGVGCLIDKRKGGGITHEEAMYLLENRVNGVIARLRAALPCFANLSEPRRGVLINMAFNMGVPGLLGFKKMLSLLDVGDYDGAASEMLDSAWATQVGERSRRLAVQMQMNEWV